MVDHCSPATFWESDVWWSGWTRRFKKSEESRLMVFMVWRINWNWEACLCGLQLWTVNWRVPEVADIILMGISSNQLKQIRVKITQDWAKILHSDSSNLLYGRIWKSDSSGPYNFYGVLRFLNLTHNSDVEFGFQFYLYIILLSWQSMAYPEG